LENGIFNAESAQDLKFQMKKGSENLEFGLHHRTVVD